MAGQPSANDVRVHPLDEHGGPRKSADTMSEEQARQQMAADAAHKAEIETKDPE